MDKFRIFIFLLFLISKAYLKLTNEKREELLSKLTRKVTLDSFDDLKNKFKSKILRDTIDYDPAQIEKLLQMYDFPQEFNFLEENNATIRVKDQGYCGCCWSHAATSSLAYRYLKLGIDVDLSPQDGLSCYLRDCDYGNYLIDPELNLIKNGTLTEGCLPFSSYDGRTMEPCPTSCKDGSEFKKYYAQNAYMTEDYYSKDNFYDIVLLIVDQLIRKGPVVAGIDVFEDFMDWHDDSQKCHDDVYIYDEDSEYLGGHAVTVVGYGFLNNKYYWLIQNSWGEEACDKGFVKVGFGQIGVEQMGFAEPYLPQEGIIPKEIPVSLVSLNEECDLTVKTTSSYDDWENTLDINFRHEQKPKDFNYQCGTNDILQKGTVLKCYYDYLNFYAYKGFYEFKGSQSLGTENKFILDNTFSGKKFQFSGLDYITCVLSEYLYVSEEGSKILFLYSPEEGDDSVLPQIYANKNALSKPLSDCHKAPLPPYDEYISYIYCNIKADEVDYFKDSKHQDDSPMVYDVLCGYKEDSGTIVYKLDKTLYPVFRVKKLIYPETHNVTETDGFTLIVDIEGSIDGYKKDQMFMFFINIEINQTNSSNLEMLCTTGVPDHVGNDLNITCSLNLDRGESILYDNIYILPFNFPYFAEVPYEVIIKDIIKGEDPHKDEPISSSNFYKISLSFILAFLLLF